MHNHEENTSSTACPACTKQKVDMYTIEKLIEKIKEKSMDGKLTILEVYAAARDIIFGK